MLQRSERQYDVDGGIMALELLGAGEPTTTQRAGAEKTLTTTLRYDERVAGGESVVIMHFDLVSPPSKASVLEPAVLDLSLMGTTLWCEVTPPSKPAALWIKHTVLSALCRAGLNAPTMDQGDPNRCITRTSPVASEARRKRPFLMP